MIISSHRTWLYLSANQRQIKIKKKKKDFVGFFHTKDNWFGTETENRLNVS